MAYGLLMMHGSFNASFCLAAGWRLSLDSGHVRRDIYGTDLAVTFLLQYTLWWWPAESSTD